MMTSAGQRTVIEEFLRAHPGYYCAECVATSLRLPPSYVTMVVLGLRPVTAFETAIDYCCRCRRLRLVVTARPSEGAAASGSP